MNPTTDKPDVPRAPASASMSRSAFAPFRAARIRVPLLLALALATPAPSAIAQLLVSEPDPRLKPNAYDFSNEARLFLRERALVDEFRDRPGVVVARLRAEWGAIPADPARAFALADLELARAAKLARADSVAALERARDAAILAHDILARPGIDVEVPPDFLQRALDLYNRAVLALLDLSKAGVVPGPRPPEHPRLWRQRLALAGVEPRPLHPDLDPGLADELVVSRDVAVPRNISFRNAVSGIGVPVVWSRLHPEGAPREGVEAFFPPATEFVATAIVRPLSLDPPRLELLLVDPHVHDTVRLRSGAPAYRLAADFTAPLGRNERYINFRAFAVAGVLRPSDFSDKAGIYLLHPPRPGKIPLLLIHGLQSSPELWEEMINSLLADPHIRHNYQIWVAFYPTGSPILLSAQRVRASYRKLRIALREQGLEHPNLDRAVVVGHSMGGVIARVLLLESGLVLWNSLFTLPPDRIRLAPKTRALLEEALILHPEPSIARAVYIAAPHRGSLLANRFVGRFFSALVRRDDVRSIFDEVRELNGPRAVRPDRAARLVSGIDNLRVDAPPLNLTSRLPAAPVPFHSIIGDAPRVRLDPDRVTDTVVPYESAHLDGAESELIVPYNHMMVDRALTIREVRRILRLHLATPARP